jgi:hypothetical protein
MSTDDLEKLPVVDVDAEVAARTLRRALAAFEDEQELRRQPLVLSAIHRLSRAAFPVAVAGAVGTYLIWAVTTASALYP